MPGYALRAPGERNRGCDELGLTAAQRRDRGISLANRSTERHPRTPRTGLRTIRALAPLSLRPFFIDGSSSVSYLLYCIFRGRLPAARPSSHLCIARSQHYATLSAALTNPRSQRKKDGVAPGGSLSA